MISRQLSVSNKLGLHARASSKLIDVAEQFYAESWIDTGTKKANAKSIMTLLVLGAKFGDTVTISCEGKDEQHALDAICKLFDDKFYEEE
jgi:phosphotransferase system HPr (HPr) family protein